MEKCGDETQLDDYEEMPIEEFGDPALLLLLLYSRYRSYKVLEP